MSIKRVFTEEQKLFVRENAPIMSTRQLAGAFTERFNESVGQTMIRRLLDDIGCKTANGKNDFVPVGTERYSAYYDCMVVKTGETHVKGIADRKIRDRLRNQNWALKQNLVYEQTIGKKLPKGYVVVFLDRDRMNYDPDNLYAVPLQVVGTIAKMHMNSEDPDIYKTALIWGELYFELKKQKTHVDYL